MKAFKVISLALLMTIMMTGCSSSNHQQISSRKENSAQQIYNVGAAAYDQENYGKAREYFEKAAKKGHVEAQFYLGLIYAGGLGVTQNFPKALKYYEQAAAQGYSNAQYNLGVMYEKGFGVPKNLTKARQYYKEAAAQGNPSAEYNLEVMDKNQK